MEISLNAIIDRVQVQFAELLAQKEENPDEPGIDGRLKILEDRLDDITNRLETRREALRNERECTVSNIVHLGSAWVMPHPGRENAIYRPMVADPEIERIAVRAAIAHEESLGWIVESVEADNRGFDLISRKPHPEDARTAMAVRFIEVKGRAYQGEIALTSNEYHTAKRLKDDYWLYVVFNCATEPSLNRLQNPGELDWQAVMAVEHYKLNIDSTTSPVRLRQDPAEYD